MERCHLTRLTIPECSCEECHMRILARRDVTLIDAGISPSRDDVARILPPPVTPYRYGAQGSS